LRVYFPKRPPSPEVATLLYGATNTDERTWHAIDPDAAVSALESSARDGLTGSAAAERLAHGGPNALAAEGGTTLPALVLAQVANPLVYLLAGAGVVSLLAGKTFDAGVIAAIVVANVIIGVVQEYRAEAALDALRRLSSPQARVVRDGQVRVIDAADIVPGDVLVLETGDRVAADARLLTVTDLRVDESALTGESDPVEKSTEPVDESTPLAERTSMAYSSTPVVAGRATAIVTATGMDTVVGRIADEVRSASRQETPLQARLARLSTRLGIFSVAAAALIFALGVLRGEKLIEMLLFAVAAAVSAIPEGLPTAVSVSLALGVQRMAKRRAIVRRLAAVETLGSCTVVCTDKTGTLTRNEMTVTRMWAGGDAFRVTGEGFSPEGEVVPEDGADAASPGLAMLLEIGCAVNNSVLESDPDGRWAVAGNPTDGALLAVALKGGTTGAGRCDGSRIDEIPFSSAFKYMATLDRTLADGAARLHIKGAPDRLLGFCDHILLGGEVLPLTEDRRALVERVQEAYADDALRVVAAAYKDMPPGTVEADRAEAERGCVFAGLWGLMDPPRPEAAHAVAAAQRAGIAVKMITGDHASTGAAIARRVGILPEDASTDAVMTGADLDALDDEALAGRVRSVSVFARVEPRHKIRIVAALQALGEVVSMTGDGVNDAPALKRADIGVAMGITGTEVSKEAADMVLADDDFATIVSAVEEGRVIYGNLQRVVAFLLTIALGEVLMIAGSQVLGWPLPISAVMVLWVNLVVASTLTIPLGVEPRHDDVLAEPPRPPAQGLINRRAGTRIAAGAVLTAVATLIVFGVFLRTSSVLHAQTMTFATLVCLEWAHAIGSRSWSVPLTRLGLASNRGLVGGLLAGVVLQWLAVSSPAAERVLGTGPLGPAEWALAVAVGTSAVALAAVMTHLEGRRTR
jgi:Ca2+-transporting ATPase